MRREIITCDVCGIEKGSANGWCGVQEYSDGHFAARDFADIESTSLSNYEHICGSACLHKRIEQWASKS